jgi:hypothetical protein
MPLAAEIINLDTYRRPRVRVESERDHRNRNRTAYRLTGVSERDVQDYIFSLVEEVTQAGAGFGNFTPPQHIGHGCYVALGEIIVTREIAK